MPICHTDDNQMVIFWLGYPINNDKPP